MDEKRWVCLVHCVVGARFRKVGGEEGLIERKKKRKDFVRGPLGGSFRILPPSGPPTPPQSPPYRPGVPPGTPVEGENLAKIRGQEKREGKAAQSDANGGHRILGGDLLRRVVDG